jgi:hypothetical protein
MTPLLCAAKYGHNGVVQVLLKLDPDGADAKDTDGLSCKDWMERRQSRDWAVARR